METTSFWTNIPTGIWVLGGALIGSLGTLLATYISKRSEERKHLNLLVKLGLGVKATLYTLLIRRNGIGCGYGAAVAD